MYILVTFILFILVNEICIYSVCNVYVKKNIQSFNFTPERKGNRYRILPSLE